MKPVLLFLLLSAGAAFTGAPRIHKKDFAPLADKNWEGTLTYLDYSSDRKYTIPAQLKVVRTPDPATWIFNYSYPKEPHANSRDTIRISADLRRINDESVISRQKRNGVVTLVTTTAHDRDGKPKTFRYTYRISGTRFTRQKEEKEHLDSPYLLRHIYEYQAD